MDDWERRQKLEEALRDAVSPREPTPAEARTAKRNGRSQRPMAMIAVLLLGWGCLAYIWLARPAFVFGPGAPPPPSAEVREAALRFAMYLERRRVDAHSARHGRLPATLDEVGPVEEGVSYQRTGSGYVIIGLRNDMTLRLTSTMDADSFLGRSLDLLGQ